MRSSITTSFINFIGFKSSRELLYYFYRRLEKYGEGYRQQMECALERDIRVSFLDYKGIPNNEIIIDSLAKDASFSGVIFSFVSHNDI